VKEKILITTSTFAAADRTPLKMLEDAGFEVILNPYKRKLEKTETKELLKGVTGLIAGLETLDREVMLGSSLKAISRCGSGMSNVDIEAAKDHGIIVRNTPDAPTVSVAELTLAAMLALLKGLCIMDGDLHRSKWNKRNGLLLEGKTVLIIGFGRIGRKVSDLVRAFGAKVAAVDPFAKDPDIPLMKLDEALPKADIITLHLSGEDRVLSEKEFGLMKDGVFLLNGARGGLVDETALIKALKSGKVIGAWLDTFEKEPYSGPLEKFPQVILTPHVGSYTAECRLSMETEAAQNLIDAIRKGGK